MSVGTHKLRALPAITLVCLLTCFGEARGQSMSHTGPITRVAVDPAKRVLITASEDKSVRIWDRQSGAPILTLSPDVNMAIYRPEFSADGALIVGDTVFIEGTTPSLVPVLLDASTGERRALLPPAPALWPLKPPALLYDVLLSADGSRLLATYDDASVRLWAVEP